MFYMSKCSNFLIWGWEERYIKPVHQTHWIHWTNHSLGQIKGVETFRLGSEGLSENV